ncbi:Type IV pilus assembly protein PilM [Sterolibacterium denitrificans]|uniref:Type IV pilus assembly protein PilM n=1 Tax=Sterolibacterium denitrificans TaxID=157592 RepID=A0A7Z7MV73_9PROT|nr:Type IV pilus assembly protein PilM [Sterolibacterium denitrificans]
MQIDLSIFNPKNRPLIGVDISTSSVKMVELVDAGKGVLRIERYTIEPLPRDAVVDGNIANFDQVADGVKRAWKRLGSSTRYAALALPAAAVITRKIILAADLREQEMEVQVESEANQYIPFALDEVNLDFQILGPAPSSQDEVEVLIAASRKEKVEDRVACAEAAGLRALVVDVESYATLSAFELVGRQLPGGGKDLLIALIDVGANVMGLTMLRNGQQIYAREQAFGGNLLTQEIMRAYGMSYEEADAAKRSHSLPENYEAELLKPFMDNLALEVSRALQFFFSSGQSQHTKVDQIVLAGGCAVIPGLDVTVKDRIGIPTHIANPFVNMPTSARIRPKQLLADAPSLLVACGLALRRFDQ